MSSTWPSLLGWITSTPVEACWGLWFSWILTFTVNTSLHSNSWPYMKANLIDLSDPVRTILLAQQNTNLRTDRKRSWTRAWHNVKSYIIHISQLHSERFSDKIFYIYHPRLASVPLASKLIYHLPSKKELGLKLFRPNLYSFIHVAFHKSICLKSDFVIWYHYVHFIKC